MTLAFFEVCDFATHYAALLALEPDHNLTCDYVGRFRTRPPHADYFLNVPAHGLSNLTKELRHRHAYPLRQG